MFRLDMRRHRELDDLGRRLRDTETELEAERRRSAASASVHRRELGAALAEGVEARGLTGDLKASLKVCGGEGGVGELGGVLVLRYRLADSGVQQK